MQATAGKNLVFYQAKSVRQTNNGGSSFTTFEVEYRVSQKRCVLGTMLLKNTNRKPCTIFRMVPLLMTLSELWPWFQGHDILWRLHKRKLYLTYGILLFGDLDWPLNASRGFVSISWASCLKPTSRTVPYWTELTGQRFFIFSYFFIFYFGSCGRSWLNCQLLRVR